MSSISKPGHCTERPPGLVLLSAYQEYLMTFKLMASRMVQRARPLITCICVVGAQRVKRIKNARYLKKFFLGHRWINNQRKSNFVWYNTLHWKIIELICCAPRLPMSPKLPYLSAYCDMKTSTVTPSFYYILNISLSCDNSIPSFIGNLWQVLLLGNHLKWNGNSW